MENVVAEERVQRGVGSHPALPGVGFLPVENLEDFARAGLVLRGEEVVVPETGLVVATAGRDAKGVYYKVYDAHGNWRPTRNPKEVIEMAKKKKPKKAEKRPRARDRQTPKAATRSGRGAPKPKKPSVTESTAAEPRQPVSGQAKGRDPRLPAPGMVLQREYKGTKHEVKVLDEGFEYAGRTYRSLSAIAGAIAGCAWNGFAFFGLKRAATAAGPSKE